MTSGRGPPPSGSSANVGHLGRRPTISVTMRRTTEPKVCKQTPQGPFGVGVLAGGSCSTPDNDQAVKNRRNTGDSRRAKIAMNSVVSQRTECSVHQRSKLRLVFGARLYESLL